MTRRIAIIPARCGSKRIPDKNIRDFCGRPMLAHILDEAKRSNLFEIIHVSTESPRVAAVVKSLGYPVHFLRPAELANDDTPIMPVLRYVTAEFLNQGQQLEEVWMLMACAPLIEAEDLQNAAKLFAEAGRKAPVLAVAPYPAPIEWAFERRKNGTLLPVQSGKFSIPSQELGVKYFDAGAFSIFPVNRILESRGAGDDVGFLGHIIPRHKAVDIDTEDDWVAAEIFYRGLSDKNQ